MTFGETDSSTFSSNPNIVLDNSGSLGQTNKRTIEWKELNNVILKDGILTIDLKNNKVFQNEIMSPTSEMDFNEFCDAQQQALKK